MIIFLCDKYPKILEVPVWEGRRQITYCSRVFHWNSFVLMSVDPAEDPQAEPDTPVWEDAGLPVWANLCWPRQALGWWNKGPGYYWHGEVGCQDFYIHSKMTLNAHLLAQTAQALWLLQSTHEANNEKQLKLFWDMNPRAPLLPNLSQSRFLEHSEHDLAAGRV